MEQEQVKCIFRCLPVLMLTSCVSTTHFAENDPLLTVVNEIRSDIESVGTSGKQCLQPLWFDKRFHYRFKGDIVYVPGEPTGANEIMPWGTFSSIGTGRERLVKDMIPLHRSILLYCYARYIKRAPISSIEPILLASPDLRHAVFYSRFPKKSRWPALEQEILKKKASDEAVIYAQMLIGGVWPEAEEVIAMRASHAHSYALTILKGRFEQGEATIAKDARVAGAYALRILGRRWPEAEAAIAKDLDAAKRYLDHFYQNEPWSTAEPMLATSAKHAYGYARSNLKGRFKLGEPVIRQDGEFAYLYAKNILRSPWPNAEAAIKEHVNHVVDYVVDLRKRPWPEGKEGIARRSPSVAARYALLVKKARWIGMEPLIMTDFTAAINYAKWFQLGRLPDLEQRILDANDPNAAADYANHIVKGRWRKAEPVMFNSYQWDGRKYKLVFE